MSAWWLVTVGLLTAAPREPTRFVLAIGQNEGTEADAKLSYAESDALSIARVFTETGGVEPKNLELVLDATAATLTEALERLKARLETANPQTDQLIVYVSSHADGAELHLKGTRFRVSELRDAVQRAPVAVAVLLLDTCQSGAAIRPKGVRAVAPVAPNVSNVKGRVIITSSGAFEPSQESDAIQGSFFTTHWVTGLRGPADTSGDGRVTLQEAYVYAHQHTVDSTFSSAGGAQHPSFNFNLRGQGDLVLSEPARAVGQLVLDVETPGDYLIQRAGESVVAGHFYKPPGPFQLALAPGEYRVRVKEPSRLREGHVKVASVGRSTLRDAELASVQVELASAKGAASLPQFNAAVSGLVGRPAVSGPGALVGFGVQVHFSGACVEGQPCFLGLAEVAWVTGAAVEPAFLHRELTLFAGPGVGFQFGRWGFMGGVGGGVVWIHQESTPLVPIRDAWAPFGAVSLEASWKVFGPLSLSVGGLAGASWLRAQTGDALRLVAVGRLGVGLSL